LDPRARANSGPALATIGWALYLACSWTWCIGMFLPVLLLRDYGLWGFVAFAVPNVVGAAAMGWVLTDAAAERLVTKHAAACRAFSGVTIGFHLFFVQWLGTRITGEWWIIALVTAPIAAAILVGRPHRVMLGVAATVWAVSAAAIVSITRDRATAGDWTLGRADLPVDLLWLAPVCAFGFALCPYLDPTFLRARRECGRGAARAAFTLGFGAFFLAMILLTLLYAPLFWGGRFDQAFASVATLGLLVGHVGLQAIFTCSAHWKESLPLGRGPLVALPLVGLLVGLPFLQGWSVGGMPSHEVIYRCFMAFYGLVFPAYVWLCMIPTPDGHTGLGGERGRRKLLVWCGAVGLAAPFFWMGFVQLNEFYLAPGLLVVLAARLAVRRA
jgi:hypothetical protein